MKKIPMTLVRTCKECGKTHDVKEVKRAFGEASMVFKGGFCSAGCYTAFLMKQKLVNKIKWTDVKSNFFPPASARVEKETNVIGRSERVLLFCKDKTIRFGYYNNDKNYIERWRVEGCNGYFDDFVTHWAELNSPD